eukprot:m.73339 g.73339  ORF g.73339 m.73339 type:complete len:325 (+) comp14336_c0_seq1:233-1207(+)
MGSMQSAWLLAVWFLGSVANNWSTKAAVRSFPHPGTLALVGLVVQAVITGTTLWLSKRNPQRITVAAAVGWVRIAGVAVCVIAAFVCHRLALASGSVAITLTVKTSCSIAATPVLSVLVLGQRLGVLQVAGLGIVLFGLWVSVDLPWPSSTDAEGLFAIRQLPAGVLPAAISGLCVSCQAVAAKSILVQTSVSKDELWLRVVSIAIVLFLPIWFFVDGPAVAWEAVASRDQLLQIVSSAVCLAWMQLAGFAFLSRVSPPSHGVANAVRGLFVVGSASVLAWLQQGSAGGPQAPRPLGLVLTAIGVALFWTCAPTQHSSQKQKDQ